MQSTLRAIAALALVAPSFAQTYSNCNPTTTSNCPADSALGKTVSIDFTSESDSFTPQGNPTYDSNGVSFTIAKSGDSPQLTSKWYIMFGRVDAVVKPAPGAGIVSSFVLQSDDLDEIDWEWIGADDTQVQTNYFGKGQTTTYNRGAFNADPDNQASFKTYSVIWTSEQIIWQIDGNTVRTLLPADADNQYPQTPMMIKLGAWSGGDPSNPEGTIEWAQGPTDYSKGPFTMQVQSLKVQDYSTGTTYTYGDQSGTWQSIKSNGGTINSGGSPVESASPAVTSTANGQPIPFTPGDSGSGTITKSGYPWVAETTMSTATVTYSNYPGLPSGWTVSSSGKVIPPSSAPLTSQAASSTPSAAASLSAPASSGTSSVQVIVSTGYDDKGFTTVYTLVAAATALPKSYDSKGFLITAAPAQAIPSSSSSANGLENNKLATASSGSPAPSASIAHRSFVGSTLFCICAFVGVVLIL